VPKLLAEEQEPAVELAQPVLAGGEEGEEGHLVLVEVAVVRGADAGGAVEGATGGGGRTSPSGPKIYASQSS